MESVSEGGGVTRRGELRSTDRGMVSMVSKAFCRSWKDAASAQNAEEVRGWELDSRGGGRRMGSGGGAGVAEGWSSSSESVISSVVARDWIGGDRIVVRLFCRGRSSDVKLLSCRWGGCR